MSEDIVRFRRLPGNEDIPLPTRATPSASGYDVRSSDQDFSLAPQSAKLVSTGLNIELPEGMECQVRPRSGLAMKYGITIPNSPGTIDPDYRGEVRVLIRNEGLEPVSICRGDRIAQLVFHRFSVPDIVECQELGSTGRGRSGFGSTGRK
jgi:dUTP pyrophosphatase